MMTYGMARKYILPCVVIVAVLMLAACNSDRDSSIKGVRFTNESSHEVTVFYGRDRSSATNSIVLQPGNNHDVTEWAGLDSTIYYQHRSANEIAVHEVSSNHVVFSDT